MMPVRMLPENPPKWPDHLPPIGGDFTPEALERWRAEHAAGIRAGLRFRERVHVRRPPRQASMPEGVELSVRIPT